MEFTEEEVGQHIPEQYLGPTTAVLVWHDVFANSLFEPHPQAATPQYFLPTFPNF